jgi:hypothetical protein
MPVSEVDLVIGSGLILPFLQNNFFIIVLPQYNNCIDCNFTCKSDNNIYKSTDVKIKIFYYLKQYYLC